MARAAETFEYGRSSAIGASAGNMEYGRVPSISLLVVYGNLDVRVGGVWLAAVPFVKDSGIWKAANVFVRAGGVWKML